ncbi:unnamed protein product [Brassica oleracea var. botrytis]|uniref:BnaC05g03530D protein n=4 Tax=Brassica TaxID=3705 RepID=A0A078F6L6_BRANA|nr:putative B3 domain-containing protein At3g49610 [Brassica napus]KAG2267299.1 hypothetical protein Bca52824_061854 [Brassica carinata]VDD41609.1 unnamed protein product [Brassica oleracea]KAH0876687.1 hypothetical protein HID58_064081 [Brassica napus]CAF1923846.1 unnamed protein product [Brassica napus]CDY10110.1 BnaC05g03530D [Brassica napus]
MKSGEDDHYPLRMKINWSNICDKVTKTLEDAMLKAKSSSSSSPRILKFDLNELPPSDTDDEEQDEAKRRDHKVSSGASSRFCNNFDLNKSPKEEPPNHDDHKVTQNSLNPKPLKKRGRGSSGRLNKAKKQRLNVALEVKDAILIFEKTLSVSDVNPNQSRFLIPFKKLKRNDFLTQEESSFLEQDENKKGMKKPGVEALLVNERSQTWSLVFKRWVMKKEKDSQNGSLNYVLNRGWNDIVKDNKLKANDKISLWSFRFDGVLCFSLVTHPSTISS